MHVSPPISGLPPPPRTRLFLYWSSSLLVNSQQTRAQGGRRAVIAINYPQRKKNERETNPEHGVESTGGLIG